MMRAEDAWADRDSSAVVRRQKTVSAHFTSDQILPFTEQTAASAH